MIIIRKIGTPSRIDKLRMSQSNISPKSRAFTFFLCFFMGVYGAHQFYLGKIGSGLFRAFPAVCYTIGVIFWCAGFFIDNTIFAWLTMMVFVGMPLYLFAILIFWLWSMIDCLVILSGGMKDAKGRVVKEW